MVDSPETTCKLGLLRDILPNNKSTGPTLFLLCIATTSLHKANVSSGREASLILQVYLSVYRPRWGDVTRLKDQKELERFRPFTSNAGEECVLEREQC